MVGRQMKKNTGVPTVRKSVSGFRNSTGIYRASHVLVDWVLLTWIWDVPPPCLGSRLPQ